MRKEKPNFINQAELHLSIQWIRIYLCVIEFQRQGFHSRGHMPRKFSEERTRREMIDPQLEKAGWYLRDHAEEQAQVKIESFRKNRRAHYA